MTVPTFLQWLIRRAHSGFNRWTLHVITNGKHHGMGWSAWSWQYRNTRAGRIMLRLIDALFWPGHCQDEFNRITDGQPLVVDWLMVFAFCRVMALLMIWPALLVWWLV